MIRALCLVSEVETHGAIPDYTFTFRHGIGKELLLGLVSMCRQTVLYLPNLRNIACQGRLGTSILSFDIK